MSHIAPRPLHEMRYTYLSLLNIRAYLELHPIFKISAIEIENDIPATALQKHLSFVRPLPYSYHRKLITFMEHYGYDNALKYYSDLDHALAPMKFLK